MNQSTYFTPEEREAFLSAFKQLASARSLIGIDLFRRIRQLITESARTGNYLRDKHGINLLLRNVNTAVILYNEVGLERSTLIAVLISHLAVSNFISQQEIEKEFGADVAKITHGLIKANSLYAKQTTVQSDNFRKLLLTFAEDVRVIIIMIADRLCLMRTLNHHPDANYRYEIAMESSYLYAPMAHRLGLYRIKGELEDMSLKYTQREMFDQIAHDLNENKRKRDAYIASFIDPVKEKLEAAGLKFEIKGRTKSIYSIWNKMMKQKTGLDGIYDLFAIRVVLDAPIELEKSACWHVYSIITDMYQPNPKRLKDWLSIPKSNGYESLHITVLGPENRWVEVQIRSQRMDEIAECGLAAHWKYKGVRSESGLDDWLNNVREVLESADGGPMELMKEFKMDLYDKEVFVFTPKGDLYKLPKGATVLDFAFMIHSKVGCKCSGARINGKNCTLRHLLTSGDTIEVLTSNAQLPKAEWLNIVSTSKARVKIKQALKEIQNKDAEYAKELLQRRFKNRKIEVDEALMMRLVKRLGYKTVTQFYIDIANEKLEVNHVLESYTELEQIDAEENITLRTAGEFVAQPTDPTAGGSDDVLVIDQNLKGVEYKLSKCCNPIYGDPVFGFVSTQGSIKIHREDCPNAAQMKARYGYRVVKAQWSGKQGGSQYVTVIKVVGHDDIGIVTNITSIISKEHGTNMRGINIDSNDGLFQGHISIMVDDTTTLNAIMRKLRTIKGVKSVERVA